MLNIIKSQMYSISKDMYTYICLMITIIVCILSVFLIIDDIVSENITGSMMVAFSGENTMFSLYSVLMFVTRICGWDINDKTINFEVLYGHNRKSIYWGRSTIAMIFGTLTSFFIIAMPIIVLSIINGWGNTVPLSEFYIRLSLGFLVLIRISAVYVLLTVILKNSWASFLIGYVLSFVGIAVNFFTDKVPYLFTVVNIIKIFTFENSYLGYIDGEDVQMFKDTLDSGFITGTIISSVAITIVSLVSGYIIFRKRDLD